MIRTTCAACKKPLAHTAPRCGNCHTRYCGRDCQKLHWKAGHKNDCKQIELGGGAEQYYADKKCAEAVAVAVEECADDTQGQTCYICLDGGAEEGLVRGCACRGASGFAHISCLARQARILVEEAEERDLGGDAFNARWLRWHTCRLCKQKHHGVVRCALGWASWKTYVGRPETDQVRGFAMQQLGNGISAAGHYEDALAVGEAELSMLRRLGASAQQMLVTQTNLATSYGNVGRLEDASRMQRDVYSGYLKLNGEEHEETIRAANNYACSLVDLRRFKEAKPLMRKTMPVARRVLGENDKLTLKMRWVYAYTLYYGEGATVDDVREAATTLEETERTARRVFGGAHPLTVQIESSLRKARAALACEESVRRRKSMRSICEAVRQIPSGAS
jgi:hypothetical protein